MTLSPIKKAFMLFLAFSLLQLNAINLAIAQKPAINYSQSNFSFTKGIPITGIPSPNNSGGAIPNLIRGGVEESIGIGEFMASRISKSGQNNLVSLIGSEGKVEKVNLTDKEITNTISGRDKPWSVVRDSKGNVYWTEPGKSEIVKNPSKPDETSFFGGVLSFIGEMEIPVVSDVVGIFNGINDLYSQFSDGDDLLRKITGQEEGKNYKLNFSGVIYKLAPNSAIPQKFITGIQMPTGIAIDKNDNLYVTCFTQDYDVKGGYVLGIGASVEKKQGETGRYISKILKINIDDKKIIDLGSWAGIDYPSQIGIDNDENIVLMYNSGPNMEETSIARINKYAPGQTTGNTYLTAKSLLKGGTKLSQNLPIFLDMAVDGAGNIYLGDFYKDRILMLPKDGTSSNDLQVFSENVLSPNALYVDLSTNQLWVKDGKYLTTGAIKKLSLYGYSVSPSLPIGLSLTNNGTITGTASNVNPNTVYTVIASNDKGFSKATFNLEVKQIATPKISYATNTYNFPISQAATIPTPNNAGGSFNQQLGPETITQVYKGKTNIKGLAFDANGNKYFVQPDSNRIMKIDAAGKSSVFLSNIKEPSDIAIDKKSGTFYFSQFNGEGVSFRSIIPGFDKPTDLTKGSVSSIAIDDNGDVYTCLQGNGEIRKFSASKATYDVVVSGLTQPYSIAISGNNLFIIDNKGNLEKRLLNNINSKTSLGKLANGYELDVDDYGNLYIASYEYLYKVPAGTNTIVPLHSADWYFSGLGVDRENNLYGVEVIYGKSAFNVQKFVSGGYTISPSLPAGLTFNSNGSITGTPTALSAVKDYTISATNPLGTSNTTLKIGVQNIPTDNIRYTVPGTVFRNATIPTITPEITGGIPQSFSISPQLPAGLVFNTNNGIISGAPNINSSITTYTVTANNTVGSKTTTFSLAITEVPPASLAYTITNRDLQKDISVNLNPTITGGSNAVTYSINPALPDGLTLNTTTGVISGSPTTITPLKAYTVTVENNGGSKQITVNLSVRMDPPTDLFYAVTNNYLRDVAISNIVPSYSGAGVSNFSINPALPSGLLFNASTGVISGKPTTASPTAKYIVTATNLGGSTNVTFSLSVVVDAPSDLTYAISSSILRNQALSPITPTYNGSPSTSFIINPTLPDGLVFNTNNGTISGTPTLIKTAEIYTVTATNDGGSGTTKFSLNVRVDVPGNLKYDFAHTSLFKGASIPTVVPTYTGSPATNFSVSPTLPAGLNLNTSTGAISGTPTTPIGLQEYTVTATNDGGKGTAKFSLLVTELKPTNLQYTFSNSSLLRGIAITGVNPKYEGGTANSFSINPNLPVGLNFETSTGIISGTPSAISENKSYTVTAINTAGTTTASFSLSVRVDPPANLKYVIASSVLKDVALDNKIPAFDAGSPVEKFSITPDLPAGLTLNTLTGVISGTPTATSTSKTYEVKVINDGGYSSYSFPLAVRVDPPTFLRYDFNENDLQKDVAIQNVLPKYSGSPATSFSISPSLPSGLTFNTTTGLIAGKPTSVSTEIQYIITAKNDGGSGTAVIKLSVSRTYVPEISYANTNFKFTKGQPISTIPSPVNSGGAFPQQLHGEIVLDGKAVAVTVDIAGNAYILFSQGANSTIKRLGKGETEPTTYATTNFNGLDMHIDLANNLYITTSSTIKKITPAKQISDFETGLPGNSRIDGLFIDKNNDLYIGAFSLGQVIKYENCNPNAKSILVTGLTGRKTVTSPAENPLDIVVDRQKNIYVLQCSENEGGYNFGITNVYKYYASDGYAAETRSKVLTLNEWTGRLAIDKKDNIYISAAYYYFVLDNYTGSVKRYNASVTSNSAMYCIALDDDQNIFYGFSTDKFIKKSEYGYRVTGLPVGLVLNANGTITGTPTTVKSETNYEVTANSFYGSSSGNLKITVVDATPEFNYVVSDQILTAGVTTLDIDPVTTGGPVNGYTISPTTLPAGITFNSTTGKLRGIPTVINANVSSYTVSATNTGGTGTTTVTFKIIDKAPTSLVYPASYVLYLGKQFNGEKPTVAGGTVTKWTTSPALPAGIFIDANTGAISGYATGTNPNKSYTVTAENSGGSTTATINIEVKDVPPKISYALRSSFKFKKDVTIDPINAPSNDGGPIISYSALSGLPAGLSLNTTTGQITGKPTQLKVATDYQIKANGGQWGEDIATVRIEVISLPPNKIVYDDPITIVKGTTINTIRPRYTTNDGDPVDRFTISPDLPQGLVINAANGEITGKPTQIFGVNGQVFYVKAENGAGSSLTSLLLMLKDLAPVITYNNNNVFTKGTSVQLNVNATGGAVEKYRVTPELPNGLSLDSLTGEISGTPANLVARTQYTVTGTNYGNPASVSSFYITIVDKVPVIGYTVPQVFNRTVAIDPITANSTGGLVVSYSISPGLPAGLSLNTSTGIISGTPTTSAVAKDYTITATNTGGSHNAIINFAVKNAKPVIAYGTVYELHKNVEISNIEPVSTGGDQNTFSITPALPNGLTLNTTTGVISGIPTAIKALATYTIKAVNDGGEDSATFTMVVNEKPPGQISYTEITSDFYVGYLINPLSPIVEVGGGEIARYAIAPINLAPGLAFNTNTGVLSGTPTSDFIRTTYTVTAHNSGGTTQTTITFAVIKLSASISKTDVKCFGGATGTATASVVGGKAPYRYTWSSNAGNSETATGLKAGPYTVTITDANNTTVTANITINEPTLLEITNLSKVDNQQNGGTNGSSIATVRGGIAPYTYAWSSNSSTTATATNLAEGNYTLTVTDANSCTVSKTVYIDAPPAAPTDLTAQAGSTKNMLSWPANSEVDLASYKVYGGTTSNPTTLLQIITAPISSYTHENLINGTTYYYRITAVDKAGYESVYSSQTTATPQGQQTITFAPLSTKTYGDADFNAGAVAGSGLTVTYTTDNSLVATVVAGKIHIVGAGTVNITASQQGNGTWLAAESKSQELTVSKRVLTIAAIAANKTYNANRTAIVNLSDNRITGDKLNIVYSSALFNNKNAGNGKIVTVTGLTVSGTAADNYSYNTNATTTADIIAKSLTISATAENKVYDGNTNALAALSDDRLADDLIVLNFTSATFNDKNVGTVKTVSIKGIGVNGADAVNYVFNATASTTADITARMLIVSATANNKVYDGNTNAAAILTDNRVVGDVLTNSYTAAAFDNKNAGTGKTVDITGIRINGRDAINYIVNNSATTTANINQRSLIVTATGNNKVYDGNLTSTVNLSDNRITNDELNAAYSFAIFDDKNIGTTKNVAVFGINITGKDAGNYTVNATANTTAGITAKRLTITANNKTTIQGLPLPVFTASYDGFVSGEDNNILTAQPLLSTGATSVSPQGPYPITAVGATAQNYSITHVNGTLTVQPGTPTGITLAQDLLLENQPSGTMVGKLSSTAPDPNAIFTYTLVTGAGAADNSKFTIQGNTILTRQEFDYETQQSFNIRVRTSTQYGASLEQTFTIILTDVNEAPTLADINNQTICFTSAQQSVSLSGITPGPETHQTTTLSVSSSNNNLFSTLSVGNVSNGNATLNYRIANGQSGTATITVTVTDNGGTANNGVNTISKTFRITVNPLPQVTITSELGTTFSKGKTTKLTATGGVSYQWSGTSGIIGDINTSTLEVRPATASGTYTVVVTSAEGCTSTQSITLNTEEDIAQISGTNIITPNGDGVNDYLIIKNVDLYPNNELEIFDRAGRKLYSKKGYNNEWNGTFNGIPLAEGTYYYFINFIGVGKYKGFITIIKD